MDEVDREVLHITDVKAVWAKINASSKEKTLQLRTRSCKGRLPLRMVQWRRLTPL